MKKTLERLQNTRNKITNNTPSVDGSRRPSFTFQVAGGVLNFGGRMWYLVGLLAIIVLAIPVFAIASNQSKVAIDLDAIMQIESSGDELAYNSNSGAVGLYQITDICRRDFNQMNNTNYTKQDLFSPVVNRTIAKWYITVRIPQLLKHYGKKATLENILIAYNAGIQWVVNGYIPKETRAYINKYHKIARRK